MPPSRHRPRWQLEIEPRPSRCWATAELPEPNAKIAGEVLEHVRSIAKERAKDLTLDTNIVVDLGTRFSGTHADRQFPGRDVRGSVSGRGAAADRDLS